MSTIGHPAERTPTARIILMYHHICPPPRSAKIRGMYVEPGQLDWQIRWLKNRGYDFLTFGDLDSAATAGDPPDRRQVILTLDDGYANNFENAFPILRRHGVRAVIYPILRDLGRRGVTWPGATEQSPADMLTEAQVREMADAGIEFGSHLLQHRRLTEMSPAQQADELTRSRAGLEALTGRPVLSIAYPYGAFDDEVIARTRAAGYRYGVTTEPGINLPGTDPLRLNRFTAKGCKLHHPFRFRQMLRKAEKKLTNRWPA